MNAQSSSIGLKSGEYGGKYHAAAPRRSIASFTAGTWCARRLSMTTTSPLRSRGQRVRSMKSTKRGPLTEPRNLRWQTSPSVRIAPTTEIFLPQLAGLSSSTRWPSGAQPWDGVIATLQPDSSRKTNRSRSINAAAFANSSRCSWTSARLLSVGAKVFFFD